MADIEGRELAVYAEKKPDDKGRSWRLRLVQWIVDGEAKSVKLERRNFFVDEGGVTKMGKADGFILKDLEALHPHWKAMIATMKNPPPLSENDSKPDLDDEAPF
jgi:hypothetical protein